MVRLPSAETMRERLSVRRPDALAIAGLLVIVGLISDIHWGWLLGALALVAAYSTLAPTERERLQLHRAPPSVPPAAEATSDGTWRAMISGIPDIAFMLDAESRVLAVNAEARAALAAVEGRRISDMIRAPEILDAVSGARESGRAQSVQCRMSWPVERHVSAHLTPVGVLPPGSSEGLLVILQDLTEKDRLAKLRSDFVANASHELRTPLASLKGFIETLQGAAKDDPRARAQFLPIMLHQADRMARLVDDLLSLSRIEMREHIPPADMVDLGAVVRSVKADLDAVAKAAEITLTFTPPEHAISVTGDRDELVQLVTNLTQNAIKYGRKAGRVELTLRDDEHRIALQIADDGIGIPAEHVPRLTERFYRVSAKASRERGGTGLGLAIVKHILNRHGGQLEIASKLGEGSTFTVRLPKPHRA